MTRRREQERPARSGWFFTVVQANLPAVLAGAVVLGLLVAGATYLFPPVYSATTVVTLDGEVAKVLRGVADGYPSLTASDYIRYEYFATHSLNQMRAPAIGSKLIASRNLLDSDGGALFEGHLVNPGLTTLLFNNRGRGVGLKWIADTQQFAISGLSRDPDEAVALSREYVDLFLLHNRSQYADIYAALAARFSNRVATLEREMGALDREVERIQSRHASVDVAEEAVQVNRRIEEIRQELDSDRLAERTYASRLAELEKQAARYRELVPYQRSIEANPRIASLKTELQRLVQEEAAAGVDYTAEHPTVASLLSQILTVRAALKEEGEKSFQGETQRMPTVAENIWQTLLELRVDHLVHQSRAEHFAGLIERYLERQRDLAAAARDLAPLTKKLSSLSTLRTEALRELTTVQALVDHTLPFYRVVSPAAINPVAVKEFKYFPRRKRLTLSTLIGAFFVLGFLAVARELYRDRFFGAWQFDGGDGSPRLVAGGALPPPSEGADETGYRPLRPACVALRDAPLVGVASLTPEEDPQTPARVLAWSHAQGGRPVLLVDADPVNRPLTIDLGLDGRPGLADVLAGRVPLAEALIGDAIPGVAVLPAGTGSVPGRDFAAWVRETCRSWERVVVVSPPETADAAFLDVLPPHRRLLVAAWGRHGREEVAQLAAADSAGDPVLVVTHTPALPDLTTVRGLAGLAVQTVRAAAGRPGPWRQG